jgi:hypothetical protein
VYRSFSGIPAAGTPATGTPAAADDEAANIAAKKAAKRAARREAAFHAAHLAEHNWWVAHAAAQDADPNFVKYDEALDTKEKSLANCPAGYAFVIEPTVYDSLEWTLTSPPPIHQFEEPPVNSI